MKKVVAFLFSLLLGGAILVWVIGHIGWEEISDLALGLFSIEGFLILFLSVVAFFVGAIRWNIILRYQGYHIPFRHIWQMCMGEFAISFTAPILVFGGEIFRAYALRTVHDVPFTRAFASNVIERICGVTASLVVILVGAAAFFLQTEGAIPSFFWAALGAMGILGTLVSFFFFRSFRRKSIMKMFFKRSELANGWELEKEVFSFFRLKNKALLLCLALSLGKSGIMFARAWLLILFLGKAVGPFLALAILGFQHVALFIPIPASLGTHEALQLFAFESFNLGQSTGAAFAFTIRSADGALALVGVLFLLKFGLLIMKSALERKVSRFLGNAS
ncbi:MAG: lysylphosphatidylglycerol synthase transmembrane domain-containing protein [Candidatus Yanofskybacteria bacterium]|nr:lysylphosphatidylglycerol synthase transmembrane domain-containing protein [Candidatus Yanofskybacteria bacterium]